MTQEEKDIILKKIDSIYGKVVKGGWDYMEGRDDALSKIRVFVNKMNITEYNTTQEDKELLFKPRNNMKYIDAEKLIAEIEKEIESSSKSIKPGKSDEKSTFCRGEISALYTIKSIINSLQQEQQEENKLPGKRTRVNYAICNLQSFKPLREAVVLDDYVYDESKCYRENLLNYINAIPESRLTEIRGYLKEKGRWPYDDDADWLEQEQPEVDLEKELCEYFEGWRINYYSETEELLKNNDCTVDIDDVKEIARHFWNKGYNARKEE